MERTQGWPCWGGADSVLRQEPLKKQMHSLMTSGSREGPQRQRGRGRGLLVLLSEGGRDIRTNTARLWELGHQAQPQRGLGLSAVSPREPGLQRPELTELFPGEGTSPVLPGLVILTSAFRGSHLISFLYIQPSKYPYEVGNFVCF